MRSEAAARAAPVAFGPAPATPPGRSIPLAVPNVGAQEAANLLECVRSGWVSTVGPFVERLEREVAAQTGAAGAAVVAAGTMGLHLALVALGVGPGDLVLLPSYTFIASANAVSHAGAVPWLVDIRAADWAMDPGALASLLARETARDRTGTLRRRACGRRVAAVMRPACPTARLPRRQGAHPAGL